MFFAWQTAIQNPYYNPVHFFHIPRAFPKETTRLAEDGSLLMVMKRTGAVSEIQGAILMLAVVVIIGAVVGSFAFGMAGTVKKGKTVAATAAQMGNNITVTWYGGPDNDFVVFYNVSLRDRYLQPGTDAGFPPEIGNTTTFPSMGTSSLDHVVVSTFFTDGTSQVVLDTYV
jgi:hypothetical protein